MVIIYGMRLLVTKAIYNFNMHLFTDAFTYLAFIDMAFE